MEGHCQIYNLPEGEARELLESSSVPAYEVYLKNNDNKPSFRQAAKAVIAGLPRNHQASLEQVMNIGDQTGWIEQGDSFFEGALLDATRRAPCSVVAGQRGVHLLSLDRIAYGYLKSQAQSSAAAAEAVAALHGAMCLRALKDPPEMRSEEDVELLTDLVGAMQAFKHLPRELCLTLAEGMVHVRAPAGDNSAPGRYPRSLVLFCIPNAQCHNHLDLSFLAVHQGQPSSRKETLANACTCCSPSLSR